MNIFSAENSCISFDFDSLMSDKSVNWKAFIILFVVIFMYFSISLLNVWYLVLNSSFIWSKYVFELSLKVDSLSTTENISFPYRLFNTFLLFKFWGSKKFSSRQVPAINALPSWILGESGISWSYCEISINLIILIII